MRDSLKEFYGKLKHYDDDKLQYKKNFVVNIAIKAAESLNLAFRMPVGNGVIALNESCVYVGYNEDTDKIRITGHGDLHLELGFDDGYGDLIGPSFIADAINMMVTACGAFKKNVPEEHMGMGVNMDGARRNIIRPYDDLCRLLSDGVDPEFSYLQEIKLNELKSIMDDLRQGIGIISCVYDDKEEGFNDMSKETESMLVFMPDDDDGE